MNYRVISGAAVTQVITTGSTSGSRSYDGRTPGTVKDVSLEDATYLGANGWLLIGPSGPTASRPQGPLVGIKSAYLDTTLSKVVIFDGAVWRDPVTGSSV